MKVLKDEKYNTSILILASIPTSMENFSSLNNCFYFTGSQEIKRIISYLPQKPYGENGPRFFILSAF